MAGLLANSRVGCTSVMASCVAVDDVDGAAQAGPLLRCFDAACQCGGKEVHRRALTMYASHRSRAQDGDREGGGFYG